MLDVLVLVVCCPCPLPLPLFPCPFLPLFSRIIIFGIADALVVDAEGANVFELELDVVFGFTEAVLVGLGTPSGTVTPK